MSACASAKGTQSYFTKERSRLTPTVLGTTGLTVSRFGFGGYRVHNLDQEHREALKSALRSGINLIDTSTNYTDGGSEKLIGEVLNEMITAGEISRDQVVVVSKAGYVQGQNLEVARERKAQGQSFPDMVEYSQDCWHNISPQFLEEQITRSLERLKLDCIDVFLLHNPEYYLKAAQQRDSYYARIQKAFTYLEEEVKKGRIQYYGVSSNTFVETDSASEFTSLERVYDAAVAAAGGGKPKSMRFAVIQFPFNLIESGAALVKNNSQQTVLEFARDKKLATLTNRPLNAIARGRLTRLSSFPHYDQVEVKGQLHIVMGRVVELEKKFSGGKIPKGLMWGHALREGFQQIEDILMWRDVLYHQILPSLDSALERLGPAQSQWAYDYRTNALELLSLMTKNLEALGNEKASFLQEQVVTSAPSLKETPTLSQQVLRAYISVPGVNSVLVGMRQVSYVDDVTRITSVIAPEEAMKLLTDFRKR
jgi:uncharacterized protein